MEVFDWLGDFFTGITAFVEAPDPQAVRLVERARSPPHRLRPRQAGHDDDRPRLDCWTASTSSNRNCEKLSDDELKETASKLRAKLADGETLDDLLPEAFAACREAGRRT